jgi:hypothetical protein
MKIRNPYRNLPQWYRGNTHTHSNLSDGDWPPEQVVAYYRDRGYAFLAVTDHDVFTDLSQFTTPAFLALSSDEVTVRGRDHIVGLNLKGPVEPFTDHQQTIDAINDQGGLAILAHPNWSAFGLERCFGLHRYAAVEKVWCSPAIEIRFMTGDPNPASRVRGDALMQAEYTPRPGDPYVRIEVVDAQMGSAWSQPFFIDPDWRP